MVAKCTGQSLTSERGLREVDAGAAMLLAGHEVEQPEDLTQTVPSTYPSDRQRASVPSGVSPEV